MMDTGIRERRGSGRGCQSFFRIAQVWGGGFFFVFYFLCLVSHIMCSFLSAVFFIPLFFFFCCFFLLNLVKTLIEYIAKKKNRKGRR